MEKIDKSEVKDLIKGERSAVETYRQVFEKYGTDSTLDELRGFSADHKAAVRELLSHGESLQTDTPDSSGAWGSWAGLVTGVAKTFGEKAALKALKEGEEHGLKQYESALDKNIPENLKSQIRSTFIPNQKTHIQTIDNLMSRV
ncbi:MAG: DUF2383 domain-containing protein [Bdellovibrionota bacterium]|nr:DUF2383 domain-containing protein [Bdellovibrionota bacterium]